MSREPISAPLDLHGIDLHVFAEDGVPIVEPWSGGDGDEELTAVRVGTGIRHREQARLRMLQRRMELVCELIPGAASARSLRAAALNHEIGNDAMKDDAVIEGLPRLLAFGEVGEVLHRLRRFVGEELHLEASFSRIEHRVRLT